MYFTSILLFLFSLTCFSQVKPVNESKFISIGGIEQWVTIKGNDDSKPVILFLHGGPGSVMSIYSDRVHAGWEKDFILVNWDQRGAGRTFGRNAPGTVDEDYWINHPLTLERMSADAVELSEYLIRHLNKKKIIIIGSSWGSILGVRIAFERPDLFYAYIGHAQVVHALNGLSDAYQKLLLLTGREKDQASIEQLKELGPPPYEDARLTGKLLRIVKKYERMHETPAPEHWWKMDSTYDNEIDRQHREDGDDYSFIHYAGHKKAGIPAMMTEVDFRKQLSYQLPVFLIQGTHDILVLPQSTQTYFENITAPFKEYILLDQAAHGYNQSVVDAQATILKKILKD